MWLPQHQLNPNTQPHPRRRAGGNVLIKDTKWGVTPKRQQTETKWHCNTGRQVYKNYMILNWVWRRGNAKQRSMEIWRTGRLGKEMIIRKEQKNTRKCSVPAKAAQQGSSWRWACRGGSFFFLFFSARQRGVCGFTWTAYHMNRLAGWGLFNWRHCNISKKKMWCRTLLSKNRLGRPTLDDFELRGPCYLFPLPIYTNKEEVNLALI